MIKSEKGSDCPDVSRTPVSAEHEARFSAGQKQKPENLKNAEKTRNSEKKQA